MALTDPGDDGRFGEFGGRFVPETLIPACYELEAAFREALALLAAYGHDPDGPPGAASPTPPALPRAERPRWRAGLADGADGT